MHETIWNTLDCSRICRIFSSAVLQYTINPEIGDNWEYIDNIVAEVVKNIKAKKKAAAAAKRATHE